MNFNQLFLYLFFALPLLGMGQHVNKISASLNSETKEVKIQQEFQEKMLTLVGSLHSHGFDAAPYYDIKDFTSKIVRLLILC